jgi:type III pantothenate kinase
MWIKRELRFMKVLTLDVGNTSVDACQYDGKNLTFIRKFSHKEVEHLKGDYDMVYVASVKPSLNTTLKEVFPNAVFIESKDVPIKATFDTDSVGIDRLLNLYGAWRFYSKNSLVISCGTAFVLDVLVEGVFEGGFISLGLATKLQCLSQRAELIPSFELKKVEVFLGKDTQGAVVGGILKEAKSFIKVFLEELKNTYMRDFSVVITGGDGWLFEDIGIYDPLLIHKAMLHVHKLL